MMNVENVGRSHAVSPYLPYRPGMDVIFVEDGWAFITNRALDPLLVHLGTIKTPCLTPLKLVENNRFISAENLSYVYSVIFQLCVQHKPYCFANELHALVRNFIVNYYLRVAEDLTGVNTSDNTIFLDKFLVSWTRVMVFRSQIAKVFAYLDRYHARRERLPSIMSILAQEYERIVFCPFFDRVSTATALLVDQYRANGGGDADATRIQGVVLAFVSLDVHTLRPYRERLERVLIEHARAYYVSSAERGAALPLADAVLHGYAAVRAERTLARRLLHPSSEPVLVCVAHDATFAAGATHPAARSPFLRLPREALLDAALAARLPSSLAAPALDPMRLAQGQRVAAAAHPAELAGGDVPGPAAGSPLALLLALATALPASLAALSRGVAERAQVILAATAEILFAPASHAPGPSSAPSAPSAPSPLARVLADNACAALAAWTGAPVSAAVRDPLVPVLLVAADLAQLLRKLMGPSPAGVAISGACRSAISTALTALLAKTAAARPARASLTWEDAAAAFTDTLVRAASTASTAPSMAPIEQLRPLCEAVLDTAAAASNTEALASACHRQLAVRLMTGVGVVGRRELALLQALRAVCGSALAARHEAVLCEWLMQFRAARVVATWSAAQPLGSPLALPSIAVRPVSMGRDRWPAPALLGLAYVGTSTSDDAPATTATTAATAIALAPPLAAAATAVAHTCVAAGGSRSEHPLLGLVALEYMHADGYATQILLPPGSASILLELNRPEYAHGATIAELARSLGLSPDAFAPLLHVLCAAPDALLVCSAAPRPTPFSPFPPNARVSVNANAAKVPFLRIRALPPPHTNVRAPQPAAASTAALSRFRVEAVLALLLKRRQTLTWAELLREAARLLAEGAPRAAAAVAEAEANGSLAALVKRCVEALAEREYIARDADNPQVLHYVP